VKCFRNIVAILMLVLMMPLARACTVISSAAAAQRECHKQTADTDTCCEGASQACCATQAPADTSLFASLDVPQSLLPRWTVPVVPTGPIDSLNVHCAAILWPAEHSPPGLRIVATAVLRI
jgi:hypothetical protein